jgi:hypothetical protein
MGEELASGLTTGIANMPSWVWTFMIFVFIWLMQPWKSINVPSWVWAVVGVLAIWALLSH